MASRCVPGPPDVIIADYRLPGELTGAQIVDDLRQSYEVEIPAILFTGDISKKPWVMRKN